MTHRSSKRRSLALGFCFVAVSAALAGCATNAEMFGESQPLLAAQWAPELEAAALAGTEPSNSEQWWHEFGDQKLMALIEQALVSNPDLAIVAENLVQADLQLQNAGASLLPGVSLNGSSGKQTRRPDGGDWQSSTSTSVSAAISYEVDLWGRLNAAQNAAEFRRNASQFDFAAARISLVGAVASNWFQLLELRQRLSISQQNLELAQRTLRIVDVRYRNGVADRSELARQRTAVLILRNALPTLVYRVRQSEAALQVLTGEAPWIVGARAPAGDLQELRIPGVKMGTPAGLITRRPDLAAVEAHLQAANADIAQARAALLPAVSLSVALGASTNSLLSFANPLTTANGVLALSQALFDGGTRQNNLKLTQSFQIALLESYRSALLNAFSEAGDAMARIILYRNQELRLADIETQAAETVRLSDVRYRQGAEDLINLLDSQRSLFDARVQRSEARLNHLVATIDLYKAVGGGF